MLDEVKQLAEGIVILKDWLGDGMTPVPHEQAEARAAVCASCLKNIPGDWWTHAVGMVANAIRTQLTFKERVGAATSYDKRLGTCDACLCNVALKVHCPIEHIKRHMSDEKLEKLADPCWIRSELKL